jgi:hypothetical protein
VEESVGRVTLAYLAVEEPSGWIPIGISLLALVLTLGNYVLTIYRGKKHVQLKSSLVRSSLARSSLAVEEPTEIYRCLVTNTGYIGVEIDRVELRRSAESSSEIVSQLLRDEQPRKLDQGESQAWEIYLDELKERLQGETKVIAVAVDTTGKEHVQKRKDAVAIPGAQ